MLARNGAILYVGKATSLKSRVNSYFTRSSAKGRIAELLAQVHKLDTTQCETALEAALLETDEIKKHNPPYNSCLKAYSRALYYFSEDLSQMNAEPGQQFPLGPFSSHTVFEPLQILRGVILDEGDAEALFFEPVATEMVLNAWQAVMDQYQVPHGARDDLRRWLRIGFKILDLEFPDEPDTDDEVGWTQAKVERSIQKIFRRSARTLLRSRWMCRIMDSSITFFPKQREKGRCLQFESGRIIEAYDIETANPAFPAHWQKSYRERQQDMDLPTYDRLRVLLTEIGILAQDGVRFNIGLTPLRQIQLGVHRGWRNG